MTLHPLYAQILDTKVKNIICISSGEIYMAHQCTIASFGEKAITVECSNYDVKPGDFYVDGVFYKADPENKNQPGEVIKRLYTPDEAAYQAEAKVSAVEAQVADLAVNQEYLMMMVDETYSVDDETTTE